jgi:dGTPase
LGHTPFGHSGERVLNRLHPGGFTHQAQSLRIVDHLSKEHLGLNLTWEVRDGILRHSKGQGPIFARNGEDPFTLEGQLVRVSDIIAYLAHDLDDALRAGLIRPENLPPKLLAAFGPRSATSIGAMVGDLLAASPQEPGRLSLAFSPAMEKNMLELREFLYRRVYQHPLLAENLARSNLIIEDLYLAFAADRNLLLKYYPVAARTDYTPPVQAVCDFVAGMTDRYAQTIHQQLFPGAALEVRGLTSASLEIQTF